MKAVLVLALLLLPAVVMAQGPEAKIDAALGSDRSTIHDWNINVLDEHSWAIAKGQHARSGVEAQRLFTVPAEKMIYVRQSFVTNSSPSDLRFGLLHEIGHIRCGCGSEELADKFAKEHQ